MLEVYARILAINLLCATSWSWVAAQEGSVRGRVSGPDGPLPYANVAVGGLGAGATTDASGAFRIGELPAGEHSLEVRYVGFEPGRKTFQLGAGQTLDLGTIFLRPLPTELTEVVVTGTLREVSRADSPVPVEVIDARLFKRNPGPSLAEAVGLLNGVRAQNLCGVCGTNDIRINGMDGPYTLVLIDGMPIVSGLGTVYGFNGIPQSLIERVEVVKGPGAALYGSEAMGGIINIITKDPALAPRVAVDASTTSWLEHHVDLGLTVRKGRVSNLLGVNAYSFQELIDRNPVTDPAPGFGDGFTDAPLTRRISVFNKVAVQRPERRVASLAARYVNEDRWGGQLNWTPAFRGSDEVYGESILTERWELIGQYQLPVKEKVTAWVSFNSHRQDSWYGEEIYQADQRIFFAQLFGQKRLGARHDLLYGLAYRHTFYNDNTTATQLGEEPFTTDDPQSTPLPGIFVQDEVALSDAHTLLLGYRADNDRVHGLVHSPRVAYKWSPNGRWAVRGSFGTGFRVVNLFTEEHAALTGARRVVIAEELRPEKSVSGLINVVRRWSGEGRSFSLDGTLFHTRFSNRILPDYDSDPDLIIYANLDGQAVSQGVSLNAEARLGNAWKLYTGVTWMDVFFEDRNAAGVVERQPNFFAPAWSGTFTLGYQWRRWNADLSGQWNGPMRSVVLPDDFRPEFTPWFALVNLQLRHTLNDRWELYGGVRNLLDFVPTDALLRPYDPFDAQADDPVANPRGYTFDPGYAFAPLLGRRTFMGVRWTLR
jgi:outer membrane receptor for ferrienterochelin and colicins